MKRIIKHILRNLGVITLLTLLLSACLAAASLAGFHPGACNFLAIWLAVIALAMMVLRLSLKLKSAVWALMSLFTVFFLTVLLALKTADHLTGSFLCPPLYGTGLCAVALFFLAIGAVVFYHTDWKKGKLTRQQKASLLTVIITVPTVAAIYLSSLPLWAAYIVLYAGLSFAIFSSCDADRSLAQLL